MKETLLFIFTFLAYFVKAIAGFGDTLIMTPLFSFLVSNSITTPINLMFSMPSNAYITFRERKNLSLKIILPFAVTLYIGIIPGTFLLTHMSSWVIKCILGCVIMVIAAQMLNQNAKQAVKKPTRLKIITIGIFSGLLCGLFGIGALLVASISRATENKNQFRANLCCIFLLENIFRFIVYLVNGLFTQVVLTTAAAIIPALILGLWTGVKVDSKLNDKIIKQGTVYLLLISGALLFLQNILFH